MPSKSSNWQPGASQSARIARARLYQAVRDYFAKACVLEVETPLLAEAGVTDPQLDSIKAGDSYLQTSPEYAMKRLLAAGAGSIYQLGKAFRDGERGRRHNPEFTLLEWYRVDFNHWQLMADVAKLLQAVGVNLPVVHFSYCELWQNYLALDPLECELAALPKALQQAGVALPTTDLDRDAYLDLGMVSLIEPRLPKDHIVFIYDYPASQAALARLNCDDPRVAHRFECYLAGIELANGFYELTDASEQAARFAADNGKRELLGKEVVPVCHKLLAALDAGLPDCSGVALGVDRLLMYLLQVDDIGAVLNFGSYSA